MTIRDALLEATALFVSSGSPTAALDSRVLLSSLLDINTSSLLSRDDTELAPELLARFREWSRRRCAGEPVAYITGYRDFYKHTFRVTPAVLIPRPETEHLIEAALKFFPDTKALLDIGTGSGILPISLSEEFAVLRKCLAVDISPAALLIARQNARQILGSDHGIIFCESDIYSSVSGRFDLIVSNPPYVTTAEYRGVDAGVRDFEPALALVAGADGLDCYRRIISRAPEYLIPGGGLLLEVSDATAAGCMRLAAEAGFEVVACLPDLAGHQRVLVLRAC